MSGEITPISQPMDKFIGKIFKGCYREHYYLYMMSDPENYKVQPMPPSIQLC